jgi:hypothetical protein
VLELTRKDVHSSSSGVPRDERFREENGNESHLEHTHKKLHKTHSQKVGKVHNYDVLGVYDMFTNFKKPLPLALKGSKSRAPES